MLDEQQNVIQHYRVNTWLLNMTKNTKPKQTNRLSLH